MSLTVDRRQVLDYRVAVQGLRRDTPTAADLPIMDLGIPDTFNGSARMALAARLPELPADDLTASGEFTLAWTVRGAPHLHHSSGLPALAGALWPADDADAANRLSWERSRLTTENGLPGRTAYTTVANAMRAVVTRPMTKGAVSTGVTTRVPDPLSAWCRGCQATHVSESLMRLTALAAGLRLEFGVSPATLEPIPGWPGIPTERAGTEKLVSDYLRLFGPATPAEVAGYLGVRRTEVKSAWPDGLAEVELDGKRAWLPESALAELRTAEPVEVVRLLPPYDPFLQARDRLLLLPDKAAHKKVWTVLGNPGALLVDGEIVGVWRPKLSGRKLTITLSPFGPLHPPTREAIAEEAERAAAVRGAEQIQVRYTE